MASRREGQLGARRRQGHKAAAGTRLSSPPSPAATEGGGTGRRMGGPSVGWILLQGGAPPGAAGLESAKCRLWTRSLTPAGVQPLSQP